MQLLLKCVQSHDNEGRVSLAVIFDAFASSLIYEGAIVAEHHHTLLDLESQNSIEMEVEIEIEVETEVAIEIEVEIDIAIEIEVEIERVGRGQTKRVVA